MAETFTPDKLFAGVNAPVVADSVVIAAGAGALARGTVLGVIGLGAATGARTATNTGDATIGTVSRGATCKAGAYTIACIDLQASAPAVDEVTGAAGENDGDGTIGALDSGAGVKIGDYTLTCVTATSAEPVTAAMFQVVDPEGFVLAPATEGVAYDGPIAFTITPGATTGFALGDTFTVSVTAAEGTTAPVYSVIDPEGIRLQDAVEGVAYAGPVNFTITAGENTATALGDSFTVTVAAGSGKHNVATSTATDGTATPVCVLAEAVNAALADVTAVAYVSGEFNQAALTFGGDDTYATHKAALAARGIYLKAVV